MAPRHIELRISFRDRALNAVLTKPDFRPDCLIVLAHGAGSNMESPFLVAVSDGLSRRGAATIRFNFPYADRGSRVPDRTEALEACFRRVLDWMHGGLNLDRLPLIIGGRSMGGRIATHLAAQGERIAGLLLLAYPLHPAGKPTRLRAAHLACISVPMLFLSGTRDALCPLDSLRPVLADLPQATLHAVEGADHAFKVLVRSGRDRADVMRELIDTGAVWVRSAVLRRPTRVLRPPIAG